jgi:hypothetical protein
MQIHTKFNQIVFRSLVTNLTLLALCSCSNPEAKILGDWNTSSNCTSKKGVNIIYTGSQRFAKDETVKDKGKMTIASKDNLGRTIVVDVDVSAESMWSINNNKITDRTISTNYTVRSIVVNSSPVYTYSPTVINPSSQNSPQSQALANSIVDELNKSSKEHSVSEFEISQLDNEKLIVKNKSVDYSSNFDPGVCETQQYTRGGTSAFNSYD